MKTTLQLTCNTPDAHSRKVLGKCWCICPMFRGLVWYDDVFNCARQCRQMVQHFLCRCNRCDNLVMYAKQLNMVACRAIDTIHEPKATLLLPAMPCAIPTCLQTCSCMCNSWMQPGSMFVSRSCPHLTRHTASRPHQQAAIAQLRHKHGQRDGPGAPGPKLLLQAPQAILDTYQVCDLVTSGWQRRWIVTLVDY